MSLPGRPPRGPGPEPAGHAAMSASRGGLLIGLAVVAGLLIFITIDNRGPSASTPVVTPTSVQPTAPPATNADGTPVTTAEGTTSTTKAKKSSKSTADARSNDQVVVQVLNGSGIQNAATTRTAELRAKGYQTLSPGNAPATRNGTAVQCKSGYDKEAAVLVTTLGELGVPATVEAVPATLPASFEQAANCYVLLGK